jgi:hypothetical protein
MKDLEREAVRVVAKVAPWLAPVPSAFFVARSGMKHLGLPLAVAIVAAAIIETLGLSTVHTSLRLAEWNATKRKSDPRAPVALAWAMVGVYVLTTIGLVVVLEVWPWLATYAPALFPLLAVVGALNLVLISQQERRELDVQVDKAERKAARQARRKGKGAGERSRPTEAGTTVDVQGASVLEKANAARRGNKAARMGALVQVLATDPDAGPAAWARSVGVSRTTVYSYLEELEGEGRIDRSNGRVEVHADNEDTRK